MDVEFGNSEKILKPDFTTKSGREFFALYLETKFNQLIEYDKKNEVPIFKCIKKGFVQSFLTRLINNPQKRILVGISGESASGKTTICNTISKTTEKLKLPVEILSADNYFKDISSLIKEYGSFDKLLASGYDVDSPDNFNMNQLYEDLLNLSNGNDVKIPQYLVNGTGISVPKSISKKSKKIIVVEGMASMYGEVANLLDVKIFIDINYDIQEKWFINRAITSRNQTVENAKKQLMYVREAAKKYIIPKKDNSDIILNGASSLEYFVQLLEYFYKITNNFIVQ